MYPIPFLNLRRLATLLCCGLLAAAGTVSAGKADEASGVETLVRGPVHEAFASTVDYDPQPGLIVATEPPEPVEEAQPDQQPEGENVAWIPGYWAWDADRNGFLWVSGVWRNLPPGRRWMPGNWARVTGGWQWTAGYWQDAAAAEAAWLPEPPHSLEEGPNIAAESDDEIWIPGNWVWRDERYAWSAGYWNPGRADWIWTPACYRWASRGYVYVNGFWDYEIPRRGVLFAPVWFERPVYATAGYVYCPTTSISLSVFSDHLFVRPGYCHYYFGDYYAPAWRTRGWIASVFYNYSRRGCDPIYTHYGWQNRNDRNWERGRRDLYDFRRDHASARPPSVWSGGDRGLVNRYGDVVRQQPDRFRPAERVARQPRVSQPQVARVAPPQSTELRPPARAGSGVVAPRQRTANNPSIIQPASRQYRREAVPNIVVPPRRQSMVPQTRTTPRRAVPAPSPRISRPSPAPRFQQQIQRQPASRPSAPAFRQSTRPQASPQTGFRTPGRGSGQRRGNR